MPVQGFVDGSSFLHEHLVHVDYGGLIMYSGLHLAHYTEVSSFLIRIEVPIRYGKLCSILWRASPDQAYG